MGKYTAGWAALCAEQTIQIPVLVSILLAICNYSGGMGPWGQGRGANTRLNCLNNLAWYSGLTHILPRKLDKKIYIYIDKCRAFALNLSINIRISQPFIHYTWKVNKCHNSTLPTTMRFNFSVLLASFLASNLIQTVAAAPLSATDLQVRGVNSIEDSEYFLQSSLSFSPSLTHNQNQVSMLFMLSLGMSSQPILPSEPFRRRPTN